MSFDLREPCPRCEWPYLPDERACFLCPDCTADDTEEAAYLASRRLEDLPSPGYDG